MSPVFCRFVRSLLVRCRTNEGCSLKFLPPRTCTAACRSGSPATGSSCAGRTGRRCGRTARGWRVAMSDVVGLETVVRISTAEARDHCRSHLLAELLWVGVARADDPVVEQAFAEQKVERATFVGQVRRLAAEKAAI